MVPLPRLLFPWVLAGLLCAGPVGVAAEEKSSAPAIAWTEADSRLANHYIQLLQKDPSYGKVLDLLWDLYEKKGQTPLLLDYFKGAAASGPPVARLLYAHLLRKAGDEETAREFYDLTLEADPDNLPALRALAEIADRQERWAKALSLYTRLVEKIPATDEEGLALRLRKAALHREQGQVTEAVAEWNALLQAFPSNPTLRSQIVGLLIETGEAEMAIEVLEDLARSPDPRRRLEALLELNRLHEFSDHFDSAVTAAREAMTLLHFRSPEYAELFSRLVRLHERHERLDEFEKQLTGAADPAHSTERGLHDLAEFFRLTADPMREEEAVARLAAHLPGDPAHRVRLADLQMRNDHYDEAGKTLDELMARGTPSIELLLKRALVDLHAHGREAAAARLSSLLAPPSSGTGATGASQAGGNLDGDARARILDFSRRHHLDDLVERLLRDPVLARDEASGESSGAIELARFLHERGRVDQAIAALRQHVAAAGGAVLEKAARLHRASLVFKDLGLDREALEAIDEAIALAPTVPDYQQARADLYIAARDITRATAQLEAIRQARDTLEDRAEVDQRIFSLLRGHYATEPEPEARPLPPGTPPSATVDSLAEYRRQAAAASQQNVRSGDEPPPRELIAYYEAIKAEANERPDTAKRYRAAWWAMKLQDNQECFQQLNRANEEAGKPVVEVEKMLLSLAEQNERPTLMVRHLTTLIEIDPEEADDYRQRRAEMRFELGFEDEAVRELKELAAKPGASLATLGTLAKLYQRQGSPGKLVEVWQKAYRDGDLLQKRSIVKQLSNALVEAGRPEEALAAQIDLTERENDPVQRRKQLDAQLTVAQAHYLLDWMRDRYADLARRHPFDPFFPEALAKTLRAAGNDREAFEAMKRAYYMSGRNESLLAELGALSDRLGDLGSAIYYRRQLLARGEGDTLENWKELVRMLERDLRVAEADALRRRLEVKFGSEVDFLAELAAHYRKGGSLRDAERTLDRLVSLRPWDLEARFRLGAVQAAREEHEAAFATFSALIEQTAGLDYPEDLAERALPLVRVGSEAGLENFVFTVEAFPFTGGKLQDEISEDLQEPRDEFAPSPKTPPLLRLRAIEEAAALSVKLGRVPAWLARWSDPSLPRVERLWATRHAGAGREFANVLAERPEGSSHSDRFLHAFCRLLAGDPDRFLSWTRDPSGDPRAPRSLYATMAALALLKDFTEDPLFQPAAVYQSLEGLSLSKSLARHLFLELRKGERFEQAFQVGRRLAEGPLSDEPGFAFLVSQVAGLAGHEAERHRWLDRALEAPDGEPGAHYLTTLTEKLALLDSDSERRALLEELSRRIDASAPPGSDRLHRELVFALAARDTEAVIAGVRRLIDRKSRDAQPAVGEDLLGLDPAQGWQRLGRLLHHYSDRIPLDAESARRFVEALGGQPLLQAAEGEVALPFEQYEIDRGLILLDWLNHPEREAAVRELRGFLREPDSRLELAKALESRGFHREAVPVYRDDAVLRGRDYAPLQGLFDAAAEALDPVPALAVIAQINTREFPAPPGLTVDYLNEQHARFLLMNGDLERLEQLGRQPEAREGAPPVASRAHLPFQDALVEAYRRTGDDAALLKLLETLRQRGGASGSQRLLGGETLAKAGRHGEALAWIEPLALDSSEPSLQRRALLAALESHSATGWKDPAALREMALAAFERQPAAVTRRLATALFEAGRAEDALGVLKRLQRGSSDRVQRTATTLEVLRLERRRGTPWRDLVSEWEILFHHFPSENRPAPARGTSEPDPTRLPAAPPSASELVRWILADPDRGDLPELLEDRPVPRPVQWLRDLLVAGIRGNLAPVVRSRLADLSPASPEAALLLATLPAFGDPGKDLARAWVEESGLPGTAFFRGQPARQVAFFHELGDRARLIEVHHHLVREAGSDQFHQGGLDDWVPTLQTRRSLPALFHSLGETELARSLFRAYDRTLVTYQWNHTGFLEDEVAFLIDSGAYPEAEEMLRRILRKSLRVDLRLLPRLYAAWGKTADWEQRTRDFHLTRGQEVLIRNWMDALAEGRELRDIRDPW